VGHTHFAANIMHAIDLLEFLSARHLPFTVQDLCAELECADTTARRILRTVEVRSWVTRIEDISKPERGHPQHSFRSNVRIRRLSNGD
jgi:predicted ArsR family transcriptional regulator